MVLNRVGCCLHCFTVSVCFCYAVVAVKDSNAGLTSTLYGSSLSGTNVGADVNDANIDVQ